MAKALFSELPWDGRRRKMGELFDLDHVAQLREIQKARLKNGEPGIGREVEELIRRLTSGGVAGKSDNLRTIQAKRLWDLGVGRELGFADFAAFLAMTPKVPPLLCLPDEKFPLLVLVEPRLPLKMLCVLGNVDFDGDDNTFQPWDARCMRQRQPYWIRMQDGRKNRGRSVADCRESFARNECGLTALEGVSAYLQHPEVVADLKGPDGHAIDLSGSVNREDRAYAAYLDVLGGQAKLGWCWRGDAVSRCSSASCRVA